MKTAAFACTALALYLAATCARLGTTPAFEDDEGWIASSSYKLATEGVYGSDLLAGYFGSERHTFHHLPLYPLVQAAGLRLAGTSVATVRAPSVAAGAAVLVFVLLIAHRVGGARTAAVAGVLLLTLRLGGRGSGVPLLDSARIARYDVAVPAFVLAAAWLFLRADRSRARGLGVGALAGLASLCHVYGAFALPAFVGIALVRDGRRSAAWIAAGFALSWIPCAAYAAAHAADFAGQLRRWDGAFDLSSPMAYLRNALLEPSRYESLLGGSWWRPGLWAAGLGVPAALVACFRDRPAASSARVALAVLFATQAALFALLLRVKTYNYAIALWPFAVLFAALLGVSLWDRGGRAARAALAVATAAIVVEGARAVVGRIETPGTSHAALATRLAERVPVGARVLALPRFWLGLRDHQVRSWTLPFYLAETRYSPSAVTYDVAFDALAPDAIVVDPDMRRFLADASRPDHERHPAYVAFEGYRARRGMTSPATIEDPTYGSIDVYVAPAR